jgi:FolB domain-containing protein
MKSKLHVRDYSLQVLLGWGSEERSRTQKVLLSFEIEFSKLPPVCQTDELSDTYCYGELCDAMLAHTTNREFKTVEHLTQSLHSLLRAKISKGPVLTLRVHKLHPPVLGLWGGVSFEISE